MDAQLASTVSVSIKRLETATLASNLNHESSTSVNPTAAFPYDDLTNMLSTDVTQSPKSNTEEEPVAGTSTGGLTTSNGDHSKENSSFKNNTSVAVRNEKRKCSTPVSSNSSKLVLSPNKKRRRLDTASTLLGNEKSKLKQVAFTRNSPTKLNYAATTTLKTIKKYRTARNASAGSPEKTKSSPLKCRVMPKRKPKTEIKKKNLLKEKDDEDEDEDDEDDDEVNYNGEDKSEEQKEVDEDDQVRQWLACNEEYDLRPVRAAAVAAAKKGQIGAIKSRGKKVALFRIPKEKVPKGKSRRTIMKRAANPQAVRGLPNDNEMTFHNSLSWAHKYFQIGDIVSCYNRENSYSGPFYLQIFHLFTDEYFREGAGMRFLVPLPGASKCLFDPKNYKLSPPSVPEHTRWLSEITLEARCPLEYYTCHKETLYLEPKNGTIYIRTDQAKNLIGEEKVDFPELKEYREKLQREVDEEEKLLEKEKSLEDNDERGTGNKQDNASPLTPKANLTQENSNVTTDSIAECCENQTIQNENS